MRSVPAAFAAALADIGARLVWLVEIDDVVPVYRTTAGQDVLFAPAAGAPQRTYLADDLSFGAMDANTQGRQPTLDLRIQNVKHPETEAAAPWGSILGARTMNGVAVTFRLVDLDQLADPAAQIEIAGWTISGPRLEGSNVVFPLGPDFHQFVLTTPQGVLKGDRCIHDLGDELCLSEVVDTEPHCRYSLSGCRRHHPETALRMSQMPYRDPSLRRTA